MKRLFLAALVCAATPAWAAPISIRVVSPDNQPVPTARVEAVRAGYQGAPVSLPVVGAKGQFSLDWNGALPNAEEGDSRPGLWVRAWPETARHMAPTTSRWRRPIARAIDQKSFNSTSTRARRILQTRLLAVIVCGVGSATTG